MTDNKDKGIVVTISESSPETDMSDFLMSPHITTKDYPDGFTVSELLREMLMYYNDVRVLKPSLILERDGVILFGFNNSSEVTTVLGFIEYTAITFKNLQGSSRSYQMRQCFNFKKVHVSFDDCTAVTVPLTNIKQFFV